ncbi:protease modulator HflC [Aureimonas populi]|uniref:Protease modulator HflC n=1 Tax=Aureimonas populi TaxID=1701758 RepID=A0ABW5CK94_9HYPH
MNNRFYAVIAVVAAAVFVLYNSLFVVNEREKAIVLRFGEIQRVIDDPGLYFKLPFTFARADNVQKLSDRLQRLDLEGLRVQTAEGLFYQVDAFLAYRIQDAGRFRQQVAGGSLELAEQRLRTRFDSAIRAVYGQRSFEAALSNERQAMMVEVRDQIRPEAENLGLSLDDVRIRRTDLTDDVAQQTYERMRAERLAEAEGLRANGQVAAREIRAAADREVSETVAGAQRDAQILQGEGDAERNAIFASAFGANPEFFEFYRSMEAYRGAMENAGTTMVLSPSSDFFRYFNADIALSAEQGGGAPIAPPAAPPAAPATPEEGTQEEGAMEMPPLSPAAEEARRAAEEAARAISAGEEPPSILAPLPDDETVPGSEGAPDAEPAPAN